MWTLSDVIFSEAELAAAWAQRRYSGHWLVDCCGRHLRVVFAGRQWGGPGPDFRGAVLALRDGTLIRGDVEIHVRASSWMSHGHARDPAYAQVCLHVVALADAMAVGTLGGHVPTVELEPSVGPPGVSGRSRPTAAPCVRHAPVALSIVRAAGRERFRARAARFEGDLSVAEPDQVVWRGLCEAVGLRPNVEPFGRLAEAVPWLEAARVVRQRGPVGLAGLLLGTAGLLSEASLAEAHAWRSLQQREGARQMLGRLSWDRRQLRSGNAPAQRCRGLASLAARWAAQPWLGPAEQVVAAVGAAANERRPRLWRLVEARPWIGRGRAQVMVINVLVPFAAAAGLGEAAALFERLPGEPPNRVVRYMAAQLNAAWVSGSAVPRWQGACLQQGLLHLFKEACAARVCERCPARDGALPGATTDDASASNG